MRREALLRHPLAIAGASIATGAAVLFIVLIVAALAGLFRNPYAGLLVSSRCRPRSRPVCC